MPANADIQINKCISLCFFGILALRQLAHPPTAVIAGMTIYTEYKKILSNIA
jgi:hypothetical protein